MNKNIIKKQINSNKFDFYSFFSNFLLCAFFGWCFETVVIFISTGRFTNIGLLFIQNNISYYFPFLKNISLITNFPFVWGLPIIIIYGFGGSIIAIVFRKITTNTMSLYIMGMIIITLFELISSYFCDYILNRTYWNYSNDFLNYEGRICLRASIAWGFISVFTVKFIIPKAYWLYTVEKRMRHNKLIMNILIIYLIICISYKYLPLII